MELKTKRGKHIPSHCKDVIKKHKLTAKKFTTLVLTIGIPAIRDKFKLTKGQFYFLKRLLGAEYPSQRSTKISAEWYRDQELKAKTQAILPTTVEEYHEFYYKNISKAERQRRRKGYEGFFRFYNK